MRGRVMMNTASAVADAHTTSTSSWEDEKGAQSLKVCASMRSSAAPLRLMAWSPMRRHACRGLPSYPTLIVTFFDYQSRTTGPAVPVLADAIGACSTRLRRGEGGSRPRAAAPERLGAHLW